MRNFCFLVLLLLAMSNCQKTQAPIDIPDDPVDSTHVPLDTPAHVIGLGKGFALFNGVKWTPPFEAWYYKNSTARFTIQAVINHSYLSHESFFLDDIPCAIGKFPVPEALFVFTRNYDEPAGDFWIDATRNDHYVEIISYDSLAQTVEGRFQLFLKKGPPVNDITWPDIPDSIALTEGKFYLQIKR